VSTIEYVVWECAMALTVPYLLDDAEGGQHGELVVRQQATDDGYIVFLLLILIFTSGVKIDIIFHRSLPKLQTVVRLTSYINI
jgi:hypothetical protein